jgi:hypothetical protein
MPFSHLAIGLLAAGLSLASLGIGYLTLRFLRSTSPQSRDIELATLNLEAGPLSPASIVGEYTRYGDLFVPHGKRPTHMALDMMTSIATCVAIPAGTTPLPPSQRKAAGAPHLSLHFGPEINLDLPASPVSTSLEEQSKVALEQEAKVHDMMRAAIAALRQPQALASPVAADAPAFNVVAPTPPRQSVLEALRESAKATRRDAEVANTLLHVGYLAPKPSAISFGSGQGMAQLYRE